MRERIFGELVVSNEHSELEVDRVWINSLEGLTQKVVTAELNRDAEVSLVFVDDKRIQELNRDYREKDTPTDVLSFPMYEFSQPGYLQGVEEETLLLGDIVISLDTAIRQADEYGHPLQREISFLFLHGLLHLLGYDHLQEEDRVQMRDREEQYLAAVGLTRTKDPSNEK